MSEQEMYFDKPTNIFIGTKIEILENFWGKKYYTVKTPKFKVSGSFSTIADAIDYVYASGLSREVA